MGRELNHIPTHDNDIPWNFYIPITFIFIYYIYIPIYIYTKIYMYVRY